MRARQGAPCMNCATRLLLSMNICKGIKMYHVNMCMLSAGSSYQKKMYQNILLPRQDIRGKKNQCHSMCEKFASG